MAFCKIAAEIDLRRASKGQLENANQLRNILISLNQCQAFVAVLMTLPYPESQGESNRLDEFIKSIPTKLRFK
jgi:hypothetical protein